MFLKKIRYINFRSFPELNLDNFEHVNCLAGENGSGKTNFLEGIYLLSSNRGFRTGDRKELTYKNESGFFLQGHFDDDIIERVIADKRKLTLNGQTIPTNKLRIYNPVIAFSPNDIFLATGSSETRRRFFDAAISLLDSSYPEHMMNYERALRQRNASLKRDPKHADIWNEHIITHGAYLIQQRLAFAKLLTPKLHELYKQFTQGNASLHYLNNFKLSSNLQESLQEALEQSKFEDNNKKHTSKGPHRDDITLFIDSMPAAKSGSQGQNRALAFALKIASVEIIEETLGRKPILLIDDAMLELDLKKKQRIFDKLLSLKLQIFLTGTSKEFFDFIPSNVNKNYINFDLESNQES
ncbi:MAG: DNA replication/repair protein RecF [Brevinemataceae bacterium]